jgi:hypothetical protein
VRVVHVVFCQEDLEKLFPKPDATSDEDGFKLVLTPCRCLYILAKKAITLDSSQPLLTHGSGQWILDAAAAALLKDPPLDASIFHCKPRAQH